MITGIIIIAAFAALAMLNMLLIMGSALKGRGDGAIIGLFSYILCSIGIVVGIAFFAIGLVEEVS